jgi:hypothetical protein
VVEARDEFTPSHRFGPTLNCQSAYLGQDCMGTKVLIRWRGFRNWPATLDRGARLQSSELQRLRAFAPQSPVFAARRAFGRGDCVRVGIGSEGSNKTSKHAASLKALRKRRGKTLSGCVGHCFCNEYTLT